MELTDTYDAHMETLGHVGCVCFLSGICTDNMFCHERLHDGFVPLLTIKGEKRKSTGFSSSNAAFSPRKRSPGSSPAIPELDEEGPCQLLSPRLSPW